MKTQNHTFLQMLIPIFGSLAVFSCVPVFSDLQSARTVGAGQIELTPFATFNEGQDEYGANIAIGLTPTIDLRARYEYVSLGDGEGTGVYGFGPKFGIIPNRIAAFLPVGNASNPEFSDNWQIQPTLLFTLPLWRTNLRRLFHPNTWPISANPAEDSLLPT